MERQKLGLTTETLRHGEKTGFEDSRTQVVDDNNPPSPPFFKGQPSARDAGKIYLKIAGAYAIVIA
jgi:hypothetical protein